MSTINADSSNTEHKYYDIKITPFLRKVYISVYESDGTKRYIKYCHCVKRGNIK